MGVAEGAALWAVFAGVWDWGGIDLFDVLPTGVKLVAVLGRWGVVWGCAGVWAERSTGMDVWDNFLGLFQSTIKYRGADDNSIHAVLGSIGGGFSAMGLSVD